LSWTSPWQGIIHKGEQKANRKYRTSFPNPQARGGIAEIAARVLSRELKLLAEMDLIARKDYRAVPPEVKYSLTTLGQSLIPVISRMHDWAVRHHLSVSCK
jgi:DNA-binding HxlR family transcriptional regulator